MKTTAEGVPSVTNTKNAHQFTIAQSAEMFEVLAGLYSEPIKASLREICANAYDSMTISGRGHIPFEVYLPTWASPECKIKDTGTGMSDETVRNLYSEAGRSSKRDDNVQIGSFGLGKLSVLSYTNSFNLTSVHNGIKSFYAVALNEFRIPVLNPFGSAPTDEPNGVEVSFAVKKEDVRRFYDAASEVLTHYPVYPKVIGDNFRKKQIEVLWSTKNFAYRKSNEVSGAYCVMGVVAYPIDFTALKFATYGKEWELLNKNVDLYFDIGEVSLVPSRDGLKYTEKTITAIRNKINIVLEEFNEKIVKEEVKACNSYWDFCCLVHKIATKWGNMFSGKNTLTYKNGKVAQFAFQSTLHQPFRYPESLVWQENKKTTMWSSSTCSVSEDIKFVVNDEPNLKSPNRKVYYNACHETTGKPYCLLHFEDAAEEAKFYELMDRPDLLVKLSSLTDPPKRASNGVYVKRKRNMVNVIPQKELFTKGTLVYSPSLEKVDLNQNTKVCYVVKARNGVHSKWADHQSYMKKFLPYVDSNVPVYLITGAELKKVEKHQDWVLLDTYLTECLNAALKTYGPDVADCQYITNKKPEYASLMEAKLSKYLDANHPITKLEERYNEVKKVAGLANLCSSIDKLPKGSTIKEEFEKVFESYPFLSIYNYYTNNNNHKEIIVDTIKLIDKT